MVPTGIAFLVVLTFFTGASPSVKDFTLGCKDQVCVDAVIERTSESTRLVRYRVFPAEDFSKVQGLGLSLFPPLRDEWRQ